MPNLVRRLLDNGKETPVSRTPKPANVRPYRRQSETGPEMVTRTDDYRQTWRQVGWIGQTGAFYSLDEKPHLAEPGSFSPLYFIPHADRRDEAPVASLAWAETVGAHGAGPTRTIDIDVHLPGVNGPVPVELPLADARDLYAMLGRAIAAELGIRPDQLNAAVDR